MKVILNPFAVATSVGKQINVVCYNDADNFTFYKITLTLQMSALLQHYSYMFIIFVVAS